MQSTFSGIEMGKRSLLSHQKGLHTIGQNISNADNPAYSKQRVILSTIDPLYRPDLTRVETAGNIGQGVEVSEVRRERDIYLDQRIQIETSKKTFWDQKKLHLSDIENIHDVLGVNNLQTKLDSFWSSWQEISKNPSDSPSREVLLSSGLDLTSGFKSQFNKLSNLREEVNEKLLNDVKSINNLITYISKLNQEIRNSQALGDNPNDLLDKRDYLVEQLAEKIDISVSHKDEDEFIVYTSGRVVIQGGKFNLLKTIDDNQNQSFPKVVWEKIGDDFKPIYGTLSAHLKARDELIPREIKNLDTVVSNLIYAVNDIHSQGFNKYGNNTGNFFTTFPFSNQFNGNSDSNNDGILDSTTIFQIKGATALKGKDIIGNAGTIRLNSGESLAPNNAANTVVEINYQRGETIDNLLERINASQKSVNFLLDSQGHLMIKSYSNESPYPFSIKQLEDSGDFLVGIAKVLNTSNQAFQSNQVNAVANLHPQSTFYQSPIKHISAYVDINPLIKKDSHLISTRSGIDLSGIKGEEKATGIQNGDIAYRISQLRYNPTFLDNNRTIDEFYVQGMTKISSELSRATLESDKYDAISLGLNEIRQSISGVNIDEELAQMIVFQNGYQAGAKIIKMMDEVLEIIMGLKR